MGIKSFSKVFEHNGEITLKDLKNKTIAIDAMYQLHRVAHPFKTTTQAILTAPDGTSTNHINGILALIFNLKKNKVNQIWIFDNPGEKHNNIKTLEIERRKNCIKTAKQKLDVILQQQDILFSDSDEEKEETLKKVNKYQRASFSLDAYMIDDLKYILSCFNIAWIESPIGYEAEQLAAYLTNYAIDGIKADAVFTPDPDCLLFGASLMIKNDTSNRKYYKYDLHMLLKKYKIDQNNLIKIGVVLGSDFAEKTPGIGPKTIFKKIDNIELTAKQQKAIEFFKAPICSSAIEKLQWYKLKKFNEFTLEEKNNDLYEWLINVKGFNRDRMKSRFGKALK